MTDLLNYLREAYKRTTAADAYIIGFAIGEDVYTVYLSEIPDWMFRIDDSTKYENTKRLRIKLDKWGRAKLKNMGAAKIGTKSEVLSSRSNKGDAFEEYILKMYGKTWAKSEASVPYYKDGDLTIGNTKYQIKYEKDATFAEEVTIREAVKARG